jgi:hypothetical protein
MAKKQQMNLNIILPIAAIVLIVIFVAWYVIGNSNAKNLAGQATGAIAPRSITLNPSTSQTGLGNNVQLCLSYCTEMCWTYEHRQCGSISVDMAGHCSWTCGGMPMVRSIDNGLS